MEEQDFSQFQTDESELERTLENYDLDEELENQFNALADRFQRLEIIYQSLLNTRKFLKDA